MFPEEEEITRGGITVSWIGGGSEMGFETYTGYFNPVSGFNYEKAKRLAGFVADRLRDLNYALKVDNGGDNVVKGDISFSDGCGFCLDVDHSGVSNAQKEAFELKFAGDFERAVNDGYAFLRSRTTKSGIQQRRADEEDKFSTKFAEILRTANVDNSDLLVDTLAAQAMKIIYPEKGQIK